MKWQKDEEERERMCVCVSERERQREREKERESKRERESVCVSLLFKARPRFRMTTEFQSEVEKNLKWEKRKKGKKTQQRRPKL